MRGRQEFKCVGCGLRLEGRVGKDGMIRAYDRASSSVNAPIQQMTCWTCNESSKRVPKVETESDTKPSND